MPHPDLHFHPPARHTDPEVTVTEGQGYAMLVAGMRRDVATLKQLTVAWQANGQGLPNVPAWSSPPSRPKPLLIPDP